MSTESPILTEIPKEFRKYKQMTERAIAQLQDAELFAKLNPEQNSIAVVMQHIVGNLRSRFTNFLTSDGEKPWRNREAEFQQPAMTRAELMRMWEDAWAILFDQLSKLTDADLSRTVTIRTEPHTVFQALNRQTTHYAHHVGQIVLLAKHFTITNGRSWQYLSIAPGKSAEFNEKMRQDRR